MKNEELIKALRCEYYGDDECNTSDCPIWSELGCRNGIANHVAADALEAAEKRIAELEKELEIWSSRSFEGKIGSMALKNLNLKMRISELEAQIPKEAAWIPNSPFTGNCSECGCNGNLKDNYCQNCGARMQKGEIG